LPLQRRAQLLLEELVERRLRLPDLLDAPAALGGAADVEEHTREQLVVRRYFLTGLVVLSLCDTVRVKSTPIAIGEAS